MKTVKSKPEANYKEFKAYYADVPDDYGRRVITQWNAIAAIAWSHPFIKTVQDMTTESRLVLFVTSDWKARDKNSFSNSEKTLWFVPVDHQAHLNLEAYFWAFEEWFKALAEKRFVGVDLSDVPQAYAVGVAQGINALNQHLIDWSFGVAPIGGWDLLFCQGAKPKQIQNAKGFQVKTQSVVYFISNGLEPCLIKIGTTKDLGGRLAQLQTGASSVLKVLAVVPGDRSFEKQYHEKYAEYRVNGEWFCFEGALKAHIESFVITGGSHD